MVFVISPHRPAYDTPLGIRLEGLTPHGAVVIEAVQADARGARWSSRTTFTADGDGTVDLTRDAPTGDQHNGGDYTGVDPMGLVWSMRPLDRPDPSRRPDVLSPVTLHLVATAPDGATIGTADVVRRKVPDGLRRTDVRDDGLFGTLWRPDDERLPPGIMLPGIMLLGGSEGGLHEDDAALLAGHGYAVLALAYYGAPGLPKTLRDIPLEYFSTGLDRLAAEPTVDGERLGVTGASKGGEAGLLVAAYDARVRAVASVVGSGLVTSGIGGDVMAGSMLDILATPVPCWTYRGEALPYLPLIATPEARTRIERGEPLTLRSMFEPALDLGGAVDAAAIPVERIGGEVLLIASEDDQGYGPHFAGYAARRLAAHGRPARHVVYPGAGHLIAAPPYGPTTLSQGPGPGITFEHGGSPAATAYARADAWRQQLAFFAEVLGGGRGGGRGGTAAGQAFST